MLYRFLLISLLGLCGNVAAREAYSQSSFLFRENKGQLADQHGRPRPDILLYSITGSMQFFLKSNGISYQLYKPEPGNGSRFSVRRIDISWPGARNSIAPLMRLPEAQVSNYYTAGTEDGVTGVRSFGEVVYPGVYNNIDLRYYQDMGRLKYDYIVYPGADPSNIRLEVHGADKVMSNPDGTVSLITPEGNIQEGKPVAYQDGKKVEVSWKVRGSELSFKLGAYDRTKELVIDPLVYQWRYTAGTGASNSAPYNITKDAVVDNGGNIVAVGNMRPTNVSYTDAYLLKFTPTGTVLWSDTINGPIAGPYYASLNGCAVDAANNIYVCGSTTRPVFLATSGAHQTSMSAGGNAILAKYDPAGTLLWITYYGGGSDTATACAVDANNNVYMTGFTPATTNVSTAGSHQPSSGGGGKDGFIVKFNTNGIRQWGSFYGGSGLDFALSCSVDISNHRVYLAGYTKSASGIASLGSHQSALSGTNHNGFLACLDTNGQRQWATYYGGDSTTAVNCASDNNGNVVICGATKSALDIATPGSFKDTISGVSDGYLAKFSQAGVRQWGSYYGGNHRDEVESMGVHSASGYIYIGGTTRSVTGIASAWAYNSTFLVKMWSQQTAFAAEFNASGQRLEGSYYNSADHLFSCATDNSGGVYFAGYEHGYSGDPYACVLKFSACSASTPILTSLNGTTLCGGAAVVLSTPSVTGAAYRWYRNGVLIAGATSNTYAASLAGSYVVSTDTCSSGYSLPLTLTVNASPSVQATATQVPCTGSPTASITTSVSSGTPPYSYTWTGVSSTGSFVTGLTTGPYSVVVQDANGCSDTAYITITQQADPNIQGVTAPVPCTGVPHIGSVSLTVTGGNTPYSYSWAGLPNTTALITNLPAGSYPVAVTDAIGCTDADTFTVGYQTTTVPSSPLVSICAVTVDSATGKNLVVWEKPGSLAASFNIYRETSSSGQYAVIGTQTASQFSTFTDTGSVPQQQSYSYKITELDSCGNEWPMGLFHKTIHLASNTGVNGEINLAWNQYDGKPYSTHYIMRNVNNAGFMPLAQVASTSTSYSDLNPPAGTKEYRIDIDLPTLCSPTAKLTAYSRVSSNSVYHYPVGVGAIGTGTPVSVYPNPATDKLTISGVVPAVVRITDVLGKLVLEMRDVKEVSLGHLEQGVYFMTVYDNTDGQLYHGKVVKR